jgi:hypothetical protein
MCGKPVEYGADKIDIISDIGMDKEMNIDRDKAFYKNKSGIVIILIFFLIALISAFVGLQVGKRLHIVLFRFVATDPFNIV